MAEQIVETLPNSFHIKIPFMSHMFDGVSYPECFDQIVLAFFNDPSVRLNIDCISKMLPEPYKIEE